MRFLGALRHYSRVLRIMAVVLLWLSPPPDLRSCVRFWQRTLHLEDWQIDVQIVRKGDLASGTLGDVEPRLETQTALIRLQSETDSDLSLRMARAEQRLTIAHEMVHLSRFAMQNPKWADEHGTNRQTGEVLRRYRRWLELSAAER